MHPKNNHDNSLNRKKSVAIIGGGITGLSCGYYLSNKGYSVVVFEKNKSLGGFLETKKYQDILYEKYYHHIFLNDLEILDLIDGLGLSEKIIWKQSSSSCYINNIFIPINSTFDWLRFPSIKFADKIRGKISTLKIGQKDATFYCSITAYEFIETNFGESFLKNFWKPLFEKKFSIKAKKISAAWFVSRLQKRARRKNNKEMLGYMKGSFQLLIDGLQSSILRNRGEIRLSTAIKNIGKDGSFYVINGHKFDFVISTVANQANIFKNVLPQKELAIQSRISYFGVVCTSIISKNKLSDFYWVNILDKNIPFVSFVEQTNLFEYKKKDFHLSYLGWYLSEKELDLMNKKEINTAARETIKKMFPALKEKFKLDITVNKYAQPIIPAKIKTPPITTSNKNIFITSMDHIFPEDRGLNEAVIEAQKISQLF